MKLFFKQKEKEHKSRAANCGTEDCQAQVWNPRQCQAQVSEPNTAPKQLTDRGGLDRAYRAGNDMSIIDNALYTAGTKVGRASGWYDDLYEGADSLERRPHSKSIRVFHVWNESPSICRGISKAGGYGSPICFVGFEDGPHQ